MTHKLGIAALLSTLAACGGSADGPPPADPRDRPAAGVAAPPAPVAAPLQAREHLLRDLDGLERDARERRDEFERTTRTR